MNAKAGRGSDQFIVRLPNGMRDRIKAAAEANNRSMNAEIVATLDEKYPAPEPDPNGFDVALALRLLEELKGFSDRFRAAKTPSESDQISVEFERLSAEIGQFLGERNRFSAP